MIGDFQYSKISKMTDTVKLRFAMTIDSKYKSGGQIFGATY
jgi:hypothetical protein